MLSLNVGMGTALTAAVAIFTEPTQHGITQYSMNVGGESQQTLFPP